MGKKANIKFKMKENCHDLVPQKAHHDDAAFDLRAAENMTLPAGETQLVPTGIFMELPYGFEAQVRPRSGLALRHSLLIPNSPGTIDAGYRGEVCVIMYNGGHEEFEIKRGDRIAQMVICELPEVSFEIVNELSDSKRGFGGFGSTGKK